MLYDFCTALSAIIFKIFFGFRIKGREVFPKTGPFILASNHASNLDPIAVSAACPRRVYFIAKEELFHNKIAAFFLFRLYARPIKRGTADLGSIRLALQILSHDPLLLFPQGSRSSRFDSFKSGVGFLYKKTKVPVIAARVYGTADILPKGAKFPRRGKISVIFDKVGELDPRDTREAITAKIIDKIQNL